MADIAAVAHVRTCGADGNDVSGRGNTGAGFKAQGRVEGSVNVVKERPSATGGIGEADGVAKERCITVGRVVVASGIAKERLNTGGRVVKAGGVA